MCVATGRGVSVCSHWGGGGGGVCSQWGVSVCRQ